MIIGNQKHLSVAGVSISNRKKKHFSWIYKCSMHFSEVLLTRISKIMLKITKEVNHDINVVVASTTK